LAAAYAALGDYPRALDAHRRAVELAPKEPKPANNFAWILATCPTASLRDPAEAVRLAERACAQSNFLDPSLIDTLAAAYAAAGRYDDAVRTADQAIELAVQQHQAELVRSISTRRQIYSQRRSFVDQPVVWPADAQNEPNAAPQPAAASQ
jgi:spermidine synthase